MVTRHVVVDGSNIATEGRDAPSLSQLDEAVQAFVAEYHPEIVTVVVDATFPNRIDRTERQTYEEAVVAGEIITPPAGAVGRGDAFVLQIADRAQGTVLSNDSFQEFHGTYDWLFDDGRLIGGKPVPHVGWVFMPRTPVRGPASRRAVSAAKRAAAAAQRVRGSAEATGEKVVPDPKPTKAKGASTAQAGGATPAGKSGGAAKGGGAKGGKSGSADATEAATTGRSGKSARAANATGADKAAGAAKAGGTGKTGKDAGAAPGGEATGATKAAGARKGKGAKAAGAGKDAGTKAAGAEKPGKGTGAAEAVGAAKGRGARAAGAGRSGKGGGAAEAVGAGKGTGAEASGGKRGTTAEAGPGEKASKASKAKRGKADGATKAGRAAKGRKTDDASPAGPGEQAPAAKPTKGAKGRSSSKAAERRPAAAPAKAQDAVPEGKAPKAGPAVFYNEALPFIEFVGAHPVGSRVEAVVEEFSSHGAYVRVDSVRGYVPLKYLDDPPPRSAKAVLRIGESRDFVVVELDPTRRGVDLALPGVASLAGATPEPSAGASRPGRPESGGDAAGSAGSGRSGRRRKGGSTIRVHELAKELGLTNKATLEACRALGIDVKTHSSGIAPADADRVRQAVARDGEAPEGGQEGSAAEAGDGSKKAGGKVAGKLRRVLRRQLA